MKSISFRTVLATSLMICHVTQPVMAAWGEVWNMNQLTGTLTNPASKASFLDGKELVDKKKIDPARDPLMINVIRNMASAFFPLHIPLFSLENESATEHAAQVFTILADHFKEHTEQELLDLANAVADIFGVEERATVPTLTSPAAPAAPAVIAEKIPTRPRLRARVPATTQAAPVVPPAPVTPPQQRPAVAAPRANTEAADRKLALQLAAQDLRDGGNHPTDPQGERRQVARVNAPAPQQASMIPEMTLLSTLRSLSTLPAVDGLYRAFGSQNGTSLLTDDEWDMVAYGHDAALGAWLAYHGRDLMALPPQQRPLALSLLGLQALLFHGQVEGLKSNSTESSIFPTWVQDFTPHFMMSQRGAHVLSGIFAPNAIAQANAAAFVLDMASPLLPSKNQQAAKTASWSLQFLASIGSVFAKAKAFKNSRSSWGLAATGFFAYNIALDAVSAAWAGTAAFFSWTQPTLEMTDAELENAIAAAADQEKWALDIYKNSKNAYNHELASFHYQEVERTRKAHKDLLKIKTDRALSQTEKRENALHSETPLAFSEMTTDHLIAMRTILFELSDIRKVIYENAVDSHDPSAPQYYTEWEEAYAEWEKYNAELKSREAKAKQ